MNCSLRIRERPRSLPGHAECREAASQDRLNSKGLRNCKSRRYSLRVESLTSRPNTDRRGTGTTAARIGLVLPFCVTEVFDPKPSKSAILSPANQCGTGVTEPLDRTNWRPTSQTSPVWIFAKRSPQLCRHSSFRARGVRRPTLDTMGDKPSSLSGQNVLLSLLTQHQANAFRVGVSRFV